MKKRFLSLFIIVAIISSTVFGTTSINAENLETRLLFNEGNITNELLVKMLADGTIPDDVTILEISNSPLSDIYPLNKLTQLKHLNLSGCQVFDLEMIKKLMSSLSNLEYLYLDNCPIKFTFKEAIELCEISPKCEINGAYIYYGDKKVSVITKNSNYGYNGFNFLKPEMNSEIFAEMVESDYIPTDIKWMDLGYCNINDISSLATFSNLEHLRLNDNNVVDISPLNNLSSLKYLFLGANESLKNITPLGGMTNLKTLSINGTSVNDVTPLEILTNLKHLSVSECLITLEQIIALKEAMPWCDIRSDDHFPEKEYPPNCPRDNYNDYSLHCELCCILDPCEVCARIHVCNLHTCEICERSCDLHICETCERSCDLHICTACNTTCDLHTCFICNLTCPDVHACEICTCDCVNKTCHDCGICTTCNPPPLPCETCKNNPCTCATPKNECIICTRQDCVTKHGKVKGGDNVTISDSLEILMYLANMPASIINGNDDAKSAAIITDPNGKEPTISDALDILMYLAGMKQSKLYELYGDK